LKGKGGGETDEPGVPIERDFRGDNLSDEHSRGERMFTRSPRQQNRNVKRNLLGAVVQGAGQGNEKRPKGVLGSN